MINYAAMDATAEDLETLEIISTGINLHSHFLHLNRTNNNQITRQIFRDFKL